jgi:cell division protein FtsX
MPSLSDQLHQDLSSVNLAPASEVRRRGESRRRRTRVATAAVVAVAVAGVGVPLALHSADPRPGVAVGEQAGIANGLHGKVFYLPNSTPAQHRAVEEKLRILVTVKDLHFVTRDEEWNRFKQAHADNPDLIAATDKNRIPEALEFTLPDPDDFTKVQSTLQTLPGVDAVRVRHD